MTTNLFDQLPKQLFNPLASQSAPLYSSILLRLFEETQRHYQPLSRDLAIQIIVDILGEMPTQSHPLPLEDEEVPYHTSSGNADDNDDNNTLFANAGKVLRYLVSSGWLRVETQSDYTIAYIMPSYAFRLLQVLHELSSNEPSRLRGMICSIHDLLQVAQQDSKDYVRLREAEHQTRYLFQALKELQHNIGEHIQQVLTQLQTHVVLDLLFSSYRNQIQDTVYHQLHTTDHVSRFRPGILNALASIGKQEHLEQLAQHMRSLGEVQDSEEALQQLAHSVSIIREHFESFDQLLAMIDTRHSQFIDSAVRNVEHQLTASSTTSGQLNALLTHLLTETSGSAKQPLPAIYDPLISLHSLEWVNNKSLEQPARAVVPFAIQPTVIPQLSDAEIQAAHEQTRKQLDRAISPGRVRRFANQLLAGRNECHAADIPLAGASDLSLLIYLRSYGDGSLGYRIEETDGWIEREELGFRAFVIRRVE